MSSNSGGKKEVVGWERGRRGRRDDASSRSSFERLNEERSEERADPPSPPLVSSFHVFLPCVVRNQTPTHRPESGTRTNASSNGEKVASSSRFTF